jgi:predicted PurR-regulated permease PerM
VIPVLAAPVVAATPAPSSSRFLVPLLAGVFTVLIIAGLQYARSLLVPVAISLLLTLLLGPIVRSMRKYGVAEPVGAGLIVFGTLALLGLGTAVLANPASDWLRRAPQALIQVQEKLRTVEPISAIQETATTVAQMTGATHAEAVPVQVAPASPSPLQRVGWRTAHAIAGMLSVVFLTYFMLASGSMFRRKIAYLFPSGSHRTRIKRTLFEIEEHMSRYLLLNTLISIGFGVATWALLAALDMPNPVLWGTVAGALNYIPYLGAFVTVVLIGIVSLATSTGSEQAMLACGGFLVLDLIKGHFVSPLILGRGMPLNTVAVFISLLFWGWVWGTAGVIMAVPLTVMIQVICTHSERFRGVGILLGNWGAQRVF